MKVTTEQIIKQELEAMKDAIGCELSLTDEFLKSQCSEELRKILMPLIESDRNYLTPDYITGARELNIFGDTGDIILVQGEIETQLEAPEEDLEAPEEHTINGDLIYTRFDGTSINVDLEGLREAIKEHLN
tara:strand:- start:2 stop:394 length:393 start_codon:yes stop_codon:yes gene_type:complete